jgi:hypothetical protein
MANIHSMARLGRLDEVRRLIAEGVDVNAPSVHGFTPLFLAAKAGRPGTVKELLTAGADPNLTGPKEEYPLTAAVASGWMDVILLLLNAGANPNVSTGFGPVIVQAAMGNRRDLVQLLTNAGADPNIAGHKGLSATEWLDRGGIQGGVADFLKGHRETNAQGEMLANEKDHERVRRMMADGLSPEEYMAKHGSNILIWSAARYNYIDPILNDWAHQAADILFNAHRLIEVERKYLSGDELKKAEQRWRSQERRERRNRSRAGA